MQFRIIVCTFFVTLFSMDYNRVENDSLAPVGEIPTKPNWHWYITYADIDPKTTELACLQTSYDPSIRIYDNNTQKLLLSLQKITNEGKNTHDNDADVTYDLEELSPQQEGQQVIVWENSKKIFSLSVNGVTAHMQSYNKSGESEINLEFSQRYTHAIGLIRLSPLYIYQECNLENFFKMIREGKI